MSNSGKVWDIREAYKKIRNNAWSHGDIGVTTNTTSTTIEKIQISTTGNAAAFGDITTSGNQTGGAMSGNQTRALFSGGNQPTTSNVIGYKEFSFDGDFVDFGDLSVDRQLHAGASNGVRSVFAGGRQNPSGGYTTSNRMDVSTFASLGNALDFGDLTVARFSLAAMQSPTRALFAGGSPSPSNTIDFVTWSSLGNATDFGDIGTTTTFAGLGGSSSETRGVFGGGGNPSNPSIIDFITMASQGNSVDFGDLSVNRLTNSAAGNSNRVCFFGGQSNPSSASVNTIDFVTIATRGNATDFGDMTATAGFKISGHSNGHGGIALGEFQRLSVNYMPGSGRAIFSGGYKSPDNSNVIDTINIPTLGNASDFGDLTVARDGPRAVGNYTRYINMGGNTHPAVYDTIDTVEYASRGNAADFGNLTQARGQGSSAASTTRGVHAGGKTTSPSTTLYNIIDYITMASVGNATDFGDLTAGQSEVSNGIICSPTRGIFAGGANPAGSRVNIVEYITIASTGNATDFGDLTSVRQNVAGISNSTRGISSGGNTSNPGSNVIEYVTIASTGNFVDFGDLTTAADAPAGASTSTRGVTAGGQAPGVLNVIGYITIASTGNATDFGDLTQARAFLSGCSDSHGGLQA
jgi:hypothetical protein